MIFFRKLAYKLIKLSNTTLVLSSILFILLCTSIMYSLEPETFETPFNTLYYVMTTLSTVGYGDYSPATDIGKLLAIVMYLVGIGLLGVVIGKIVDSFSYIKKKREEGKVKVTEENHIILIGWSKKAQLALQEILESDSAIEVVIIDVLPTSPVDLSNDRIHYVQGDPAIESTLQMANINQAKAVIIFADDSIVDTSLTDGKTLLIATTIERVAPHVHTTVEIMLEKHKNNFSHVKIDEFILSHETISKLAVRSALSKGISSLFSQLISRQHGDDLYEIKKKESWTTYEDAFFDLLKQGATLIADGENLGINRRLQETIRPDAKLYVICDRETFQSLQRRS